jgi:hypothetical protein
MRRAIKKPDSEILKQNLQYIEGNSGNNRKIKGILLAEQKSFCAYTDECLTRTEPGEIEHFNPKLKNTPQDNYNNWHLVKHQWNLEKSEKWDNFQPVLSPIDETFEERIIYLDGDYLRVSEKDDEAKNLITLLKLDDAALASERKRYIARKRDEIKESNNNDAFSFFRKLLEDDRCRVSYPRAIKEEFKVDILDMIEQLRYL